MFYQETRSCLGAKVRETEPCIYTRAGESLFSKSKQNNNFIFQKNCHIYIYIYIYIYTFYKKKILGNGTK